jgi:hypothetical protein
MILTPYPHLPSPHGARPNHRNLHRVQVLERDCVFEGEDVFALSRA